VVSERPGPNSEGTVQVKLPLLAIPWAMGAPTGTTLVEGPLRRSRETVLVVVGSQVMVNSSPAVRA
jgi:hypothetical protein